MVFDAIAAEPGVLEEVDRLTTARRLALLAGLDTVAEVGATPDPSRRRALQRVRVLVLPPPARGPVLRRVLGEPGVSEADARIAVTAAERAVPLVTEDRDLRLAAAVHLPAPVLWTWAEDLRPRIAELARRHPPRRRGR